MDKETKERIEKFNAEYVHQEFPKMKHHPDGREKIVHSEAEEAALGGEWTHRQAAVDEKARRDQRDAERAARLAVTGKPDDQRTDSDAEPAAADAPAPSIGRSRKRRASAADDTE